MKTTIPMQRVGEPAGATAGRPRRGVFPRALAGLGFGVVAASAYLVLGGEYFYSIPRWAAVVFYPGFLAGFTVNGWGLSEPASKVVGVLAVGIAYAILASLARCFWLTWSPNQRIQLMKTNSTIEKQI